MAIVVRQKQLPNLTMRIQTLGSHGSHAKGSSALLTFAVLVRSLHAEGCTQLESCEILRLLSLGNHSRHAKGLVGYPTPISRHLTASSNTFPGSSTRSIAKAPLSLGRLSSTRFEDQHAR